MAGATLEETRQPLEPQGENGVVWFWSFCLFFFGEKTNQVVLFFFLLVFVFFWERRVVGDVIFA